MYASKSKLDKINTVLAQRMRADLMISQIFQERGIERLYHFTDQSNFDLIKEHKGLHSLRYIKENGIVVPKPGGNDWSHEQDERLGLDDYVHLCFHDYHPMCWSKMKDGLLPNPGYIPVQLAVLDFPGVLFAPDVSNKKGVLSVPISDGLSQIDFEVFGNFDLSSEGNEERKKATYKYEILIPKSVPIKYLRK